MLNKFFDVNDPSTAYLDLVIRLSLYHAKTYNFTMLLLALLSVNGAVQYL